jgi:hypothetical protein
MNAVAKCLLGHHIVEHDAGELFAHRELYALAQSRGMQSHAFSRLNIQTWLFGYSTDFDLLPSLVRPSM